MLDKTNFTAKTNVLPMKQWAKPRTNRLRLDALFAGQRKLFLGINPMAKEKLKQIRIPEILHGKLKLIAVGKGVNLQDVAASIIEQFIKKEDKKNEK